MAIEIPSSVTEIEWKAFGYYISEDEETKWKMDVAVYGTRGSEAERYTLEEGFTFIEAGSNQLVSFGGGFIPSDVVNISVQGATNDIKKCFRYAEWKSQIFHSIFTYSLVALIDEIRPSVAFLLSSKLIFSQSSK